MKRYIQTLHARPVHEKREFAVHAAAGVTALIALVWLSTLGVRLAAGTAETTIAEGASAASLVAATAAAGSQFQQQMQQQAASAAPAGNSASTQGSADSGSQYTVQPSDTADSQSAVIGSPNDPATAIQQ